MSIRRPKLKPQMLDPTTTLDPYLCTMESAAMGLDILTNGKINVWGGQLVPYCGKTRAQIIQHGTNLYNAQQAWKHWGKTLDVRTGYNFATALSDLSHGYWLILQGDYDQFTFATKCQDSFFGDHAIVVGPEKVNGKWLVGDPLCRNFIYISQTELQNYANKLGRRIYTNIGRRWTGQIFFARIKPPQVATAHYSVQVTKQTKLWNDTTKTWVYTLAVGTKLVVRTAQYTKGGVSCYPVSGPAPYGGYYVPASNVKILGYV